MKNSPWTMSCLKQSRRERKKERKRKREKETDRQADRLADRHTDIQTERLKDWKTERQKDRKTERQKDRKTERQKDRKTESQRKKEKTDRMRKRPSSLASLIYYIFDKYFEAIVHTYWISACSRFFTDGVLTSVITRVIIPLSAVTPTPHVNAVLGTTIIVGLTIWPVCVGCSNSRAFPDEIVFSCSVCEVKPNPVTWLGTCWL